MKFIILTFCLFFFISGINAEEINYINIDFNSGVDSDGNSEGNLHFEGTNGFHVIFTDDNSNGSSGGDANGVHITNYNYGNIKVGQDDYVLGALNSWANATNNYHSSGIIATFNQGARLVSFDDTDNDGTTKALFAYDEFDNLIGQSPFRSQVPVVVDTSMTGGKLIYKVEFDTAAGTAGGSNDGTVFTIDNFYAETDPTEVANPPGIEDLDGFEDTNFAVPEPATYTLFLAAIIGFALKYKK